MKLITIRFVVLKKKEIIAASLVVLIGVAGYLNWSYQDTIHVTDGADYIETGKKLGEAQYVSTDADAVEENKTDAKEKEDKQTVAISNDDYFAQAKMEKESSRSKALEILNKTAENESFDTQTRENAQQKILDMASNAEKETIIEGIAKAKGYENISVYIDGESADVVVDKKDFNEKDAQILKEIITEQINVAPSNVKIVQKK